MNAAQIAQSSNRPSAYTAETDRTTLSLNFMSSSLWHLRPVSKGRESHTTGTDVKVTALKVQTFSPKYFFSGSQ